MTNYHIIRRLELGSTEGVQILWRRWWLTLWWRWILLIVVLLLPFFLLYPLLQWQRYGAVVFGILVAVGVAMALKWWWQWYGTVLILTNRRIIDCDQRGVFDRVLTAAAFDRITDVHFRRKGVWQTMLGYGTVEYTILPGQTRIVTPGLRNPAAICQAIHGPDQTIDDGEPAPVAETATITTVAELKHTLTTLRQELGPEHFSAIIASVDPGYREYRHQHDTDSQS